MAPRHIPILKANKGERIALAHLDGRTVDRLLPLFEVGRLTDNIARRPKYVSTSSTPVMAHLNRAIDLTADVWVGRTAMVDGYYWPANARAENGDHVIPYMVSRLRSA